MAAPHERVAQRAAVGRFRETPASFYRGADASPSGSATMTRYAIAYRHATPLAGAAQRLIGNKGGSPNQGVTIAIDAPNDEWAIFVGDGGGASVRVDVALSPVNRLSAVAFSYDGSTLLVRTDAGVTGTNPAGTAGFTASTDRTVIGLRPNNLDLSAADFSLLALLGSDSEVRSDAEMQTDLATLVDNLEQGRDLRTGLGHTPEFYWDARDAVIGGGGTRATWTDRIAGIDLTKNGSPEGLSVPCRTA